MLVTDYLEKASLEVIDFVEEAISPARRDLICVEESEEYLTFKLTCPKNASMLDQILVADLDKPFKLPKNIKAEDVKEWAEKFYRYDREQMYELVQTMPIFKTHMHCAVWIS